MKVLQLGNGGGFDTESTSSSFLIYNTEDSYTLFDCGWGVLAKLKKLHEDNDEAFTFNKLTNIFISHLHEDHIGNLTTLIYYMYFTHKKWIGVLTGKDTYKPLKKVLSICDTELKAGKPTKANMYYLIKLLDYVDTRESESYYSNHNNIVVSTPAYHGTVPAHGLAIINKQSSVVITGDTKAYEPIEQFVKRLPRIKYRTENDDDKVQEHYITKQVTVFHDFSHWDNPSRNVHACKSDIASEYSAKFADKLIYYHTNEPFNQEWQEF